MVICLFIFIVGMSTNKEHVFVVGPSRNIRSGLVKKGINTTTDIRDETKTENLFQDELLTGHLAIIVGTYSSFDTYAKAIDRHTRLFLLTVDDTKKPTSMSEIKGTFAETAFEKGVRQIVDLSSFTVRSFGRQDIIEYIHTTSEEMIDTKSN
jgi:hypothetical protein